ncbi:MAG: response regulator [Bacteroidales bacterium]|nr:response regulator [Bacteroidales bacterium]
MRKQDYKILVVEDEVLVATDIEESLEHLGYEILDAVVTGPEAIASVEKELPNLILMDINLKGDMTGIEAATHISKNHNVPIIYLTANADISTINEAKVALPYGYIIKPFTDKDLQTNIEIALFKFENDMKLKMESEQFNTFFDLKDHEKNQVIIHGVKGLEKINIEQVYFIEGNEKETTIHLFDEEIATNKSLEDIIKFFPGKKFIQVSTNYVINAAKVFVVKHPEVIIADKMTVITVDADKKSLLDNIIGELEEIIDED